MAHEPKLSAYIIKLKGIGRNHNITNRNLFGYKINDTSAELEDSYIFIEISKKFLGELDTEQMYSDDRTKKSITANQVDIEDNDVNTSIRFHSHNFIIEGIVEGGKYGKKRKKTSTENKNIKTDVSERDAITDDFYFLMYTPLDSDKSILLIQSYSDDNIDSVMKKFWKSFMSFPGVYKEPSIAKYIPNNIIEDFKDGATVSYLTYSTEIPSLSLLEPAIALENRNFKVTIKIEPTEEGLSYTEYGNIVRTIEERNFHNISLNTFDKKKGSLKDNQTGKTTPFMLENNFDIKPSIILSKYIEINNDESDFDRIKEYCFSLLEIIKQEVYPINAVQER